ncbi:Transmembrane 7 superfamily member 3 [Operophtera brumata]|uniref:Transmembrane 7 superfamily member 3 n=1 Tax=Operophtera brumata TaxID=104452 RepID=A0A0L7LDG4_OPEBR|nr:Transmembrane 7 superfamily member 3 [Operophtera brumata]
MLSNLCATKLFSLVLLISATVVATQDFNITIPLNKTTTFGDKQLYGEFMTLNRTSKLQVNFSKGKDLAFIIFQVHSHVYNITLYKNVKTYKTSVSGTNVGLHSGSKEMETDRFFVENLNTDVNLKLYVAVLGYFVTDPIPGGCNMEFSVPISPYMKAIYNRDYIYVDIAPAKYNDPECSQSTEEFIQLRFFMLYLPEQSFDSDVYFEGIKTALALSCLSGICVGAMRVLYWWIYGLPVLSIILSSADVGFLT